MQTAPLGNLMVSFLFREVFQLIKEETMVELELLLFATANELTNIGIHYQQQLTSEKDKHSVPSTERTRGHLLSPFVQREKLNLCLVIL